MGRHASESTLIVLVAIQASEEPLDSEGVQAATGLARSTIRHALKSLRGSDQIHVCGERKSRGGTLFLHAFGPQPVVKTAPTGRGYEALAAMQAAVTPKGAS